MGICAYNKRNGFVSGTPAHSNSITILEAHTVLSNAKATIEALSRFLAV
jgi:hypothetical protein